MAKTEQTSMKARVRLSGSVGGPDGFGAEVAQAGATRELRREFARRPPDPLD